jgi:hypothetical protein
MFCSPGIDFSGTEVVNSLFHVLPSRNRFQRYRGRRVRFSCFVLPDSFSVVLRALGPIFMFCTPGIIFGGAECVGSCFHILRSRTNFRRYRRYRVPFSWFALPNSFSTVPRASGPVFMFCAPGIVFDGTEGVRSPPHVLCSRTRFLLSRGRQVPFSCFAVPESISTVPRSSGPFFTFCAARTRFRRYRGRRVPFTCFAIPNSFTTVPRASGPVIMFCAPEIVFDGIGGVRSLFHALRSRTHFRRYRGRRVPF